MTPDRLYGNDLRQTAEQLRGDATWVDGHRPPGWTSAAGGVARRLGEVADGLDVCADGLDDLATLVGEVASALSAISDLPDTPELIAVQVATLASSLRAAAPALPCATVDATFKVACLEPAGHTGRHVAHTDTHRIEWSGPPTERPR